MTQENLHFRLCLMLAFQSMVANGKKTETKDTTKRIVELAKRMNEFCELYVFQAFPQAAMNFADNTEAAKIDESISLHIEDLRTNEATRLPEDKENLIQFYDRLQQRRSRRMQRQFYAGATKDKLTDLVLRYMSEEIEDAAAEPFQ